MIILWFGHSATPSRIFLVRFCLTHLSCQLSIPLSPSFNPIFSSSETCLSSSLDPRLNDKTEMHTQCESQCDQIGLFWVLLDANFLTKVAQIFSNFLGHFENLLFYTFCATFQVFRLLFIPTSGHTGSGQRLASAHFSDIGFAAFSFVARSFVRLCVPLNTKGLSSHHRTPL